MVELNYQYSHGDINVQVMKDLTYHVNCPAATETIVTRYTPSDCYYLLEHGELCEIYLDSHRGNYAVFQGDILRKSKIKTIGEARDFVRNFQISTPLESLCSFATFKRDAAIPGFTLTRLIPTETPPRTVNKLQTNSMALNAPETNSKVSWLFFPPAALMEYNKKMLRVYSMGRRFFNAEEKTALKGWEARRDIQAEERDIMSDSNSQYYAAKRYWEAAGMPHMFNVSKTVKGLKRDFNEDLMWDTGIKGEVILEYRVNIPLNNKERKL